MNSAVLPGALRLQAISIGLPGRVLVNRLNAQIEPGTCLTVMGPSGSGKSALLNCLAGTLDAAFSAGGQVWVGDVDISRLAPEQRRLGMLFQDDLLFPHLREGFFAVVTGPYATEAEAKQQLEVLGDRAKDAYVKAGW